MVGFGTEKIMAVSCLAILVWASVLQSSEVRGSIELEEADQLLRAYARHFVSQQPRELRKAWQGQVDQARLNEHGLYAMTGVDGRIVIEYLPESKTLQCLSSIFSFRGVVRPWVMRALEEAAASGLSTDDAELFYDPVSKAIFLRETFVQSPVKKKVFIKTCDRVMKAAERWSREHYLPALRAYFARHAPSESATGRAGGFRATLVLTEDKVAFMDVWDRPVTAREPAVWTLDRAFQGQPVFAFVLFSGAGKEGEACALDASLDIRRPDGTSVAAVKDIPLWRGPAPPATHLQMSEQSLEIAFDDEEPLGVYRIQIEVCDRNESRCVQLSLPLELVDGAS
jgi:hypothetical protein